MTVLSPFEIRPFEPGDETAFRELNEAWIARHFVVEEKDWEVLNDPVGQILRQGGALLMAVKDGVVVGTCALLAMKDGGFEVGNRTVAEECGGLGIGKELLAEVCEHAGARGGKGFY